MSHLDKVIASALGLTEDELKLRRQAIQQTREESMTTAPGRPQTLGVWRARAELAEGKLFDVQRALSVWRDDPEACIHRIAIIVGYYLANANYAVGSISGDPNADERESKGGEE